MVLVRQGVHYVKIQILIAKDVKLMGIIKMEIYAKHVLKGAKHVILLNNAWYVLLGVLEDLE